MVDKGGILIKRVLRIISLQPTSYQTTIYLYQGRRSFATQAKLLRKHLKQGGRLYSETCYEKDTLLSRLIQSWTETLSHQGVPEAGSSVNLIVAHALGKKMIHEVDMNTHPPAHILKRIEEMCTERSKRVPVQYIIGEWDFHDMTLEMRPPVLIPRPETEHLNFIRYPISAYQVPPVMQKYMTNYLLHLPELASIIGKTWPRELTQDGNFLEIGCGTGALSLYLLKELPEVTCVALDKSETACKLTSVNAARYNLKDRLRVIQGNISDGTVISELSTLGPFDAIVSNPPYLTSEEMETLEKEVSDYEDHDALRGGSDGLDIVRQILAISHSLLRSNQSVIWLEVGLQQPEMIEKMLEYHPEYMLTYEETLKDFTQRDRFCKLRLNR